MEQSAETRASVHSFIRQASKLMDDKVFFNKQLVKRMKVMNTCFERSKEYLGKDFAYLLVEPFDSSLRLYIRDMFGTKGLHFFEDASGEIQLDIEHALLLYYFLKSEESNQLDIALGILYYIVGHQLDDELGKLSKLTSKNHINPIFELDARLFRWKRCPYILRKFMLQFSAQEGYNAFYFERSMIGQLAYLTAKGESFEKAKSRLTESGCGIFYSFLPVEVESMLIPAILGGEFDTSLMDGFFTQTLLSDNAAISKEYALSDVYNVYNQIVKPNMVEMMGKIVSLVIGEIEKNGYLMDQDVILYHLSPSRLGILVKERSSLENVLPTLGGFFNPVPEFDLNLALVGDFL